MCVGERRGAITCTQCPVRIVAAPSRSSSGRCSRKRPSSSTSWRSMLRSKRVLRPSCATPPSSPPPSSSSSDSSPPSSASSSSSSPSVVGDPAEPVGDAARGDDEPPPPAPTASGERLLRGGGGDDGLPRRLRFLCSLRARRAKRRVSRATAATSRRRHGVSIHLARSRAHSSRAPHTAIRVSVASVTRSRCSKTCRAGWSTAAVAPPPSPPPPPPSAAVSADGAASGAAASGAPTSSPPPPLLLLDLPLLLAMRLAMLALLPATATTAAPGRSRSLTR